MEVIVVEKARHIGLAHRLQREGCTVKLLWDGEGCAGRGLVKNIFAEKELDSSVVEQLGAFGADLIVASHIECSRFDGWPPNTIGLHRAGIGMHLDMGVAKRVAETCGLESGPNAMLCGGFHKDHYIEPLLLVLVQPRMMTGDCGVDIGVACAAAQPIKLGSELAQAYLPKIKAFLEGYVGMVCVSCAEPLVLLGFAPFLMALYSEVDPLGVSHYLKVLAEGRGRVEMRAPWVGCSLLSTPPWPFAEGIPACIEKPPKAVLKHFWLQNVDCKEAADGKVARNVWLVGPLVGWSTAYAHSLQTLRQRINNTLRAMHVPSGQFRVDVGAGAAQRLRALQEEGWLNEAKTVVATAAGSGSGRTRLPDNGSEGSAALEQADSGSSLPNHSNRVSNGECERRKDAQGTAALRAVGSSPEGCDSGTESEGAANPGADDKAAGTGTAFDGSGVKEGKE